MQNPEKRAGASYTYIYYGDYGDRTHEVRAVTKSRGTKTHLYRYALVLLFRKLLCTGTDALSCGVPPSLMFQQEEA